MRVLISADENGEQTAKYLYNELKLRKLEIEYLNVQEKCNYPVVAERVCEKILQGKYNLGILICGTGIGMCITANKFKGIYAALCYDEYSIQRSVLSNDANVLCLGNQNFDKMKVVDVVFTWIEMKKKLKVGDRSQKKIETIKKIEERNFIKI